MSKISKKIISFCIVIIFLFSIISGAFAIPADISNHPEASVISKWLTKGLAQNQPDGKFRPDGTMQRIEFFTYINKVFNFTEKSTATFTDVVPNSWYGNEIAKGLAAGYLQADKTKKMLPFGLMKRADAAVILAKVFELQANNESNLSQFDDEDKIPASAKSAVSALLEKGYIAARNDNKFGPFDNLSRAQAIKMIDNVMGNLINVQGYFSSTTSGNQVVNTSGVTLRNMIIYGNLYVTEGVGDGNVTLDNVTVKGRTMIHGGGVNSIILRNSSLEGMMNVLKKDGKVRMVTDGTTSIPSTQLYSGARLEESNTSARGFENIQIASSTGINQSVQLKGNFTDVGVNSHGAAIQVEGIVNNLDMRETADNVNVKLVSGTISQLNILSDRSVVDLMGGTVSNLNVQNTALASRVIVEGSIVSNLSANVSSDIDVKSGTVSNLNINSGAAGSSVQVGYGATVSYLSAGASVDVNGQGTISNASISATGVSIEKTPTNVTVGAGITADIGGANSTTTVTTRTNAGNLAISPASATENSTQTITLTYTLGDYINNGEVVFNLPTGIEALTSDQINIAGIGVTSLNELVNINDQTVTIPSLNISSSQTIVVTLKNKTIPVAGSYIFNVIADVDGTGARLPSLGNGNETKTFTSNDVTPPTFSAASGSELNATHKIITLTFNESIVNNLAGLTALKAAVEIATDGTNFAPLGVSDTVAITNGKLVITFNSVLTTATNKIQINASALKDASGNVKSDITTTNAIDASADIIAPTFDPAAIADTIIDGTYKVVTLKFSESVVNNKADIPTLKADIQIATDGTTFAALGSLDTVGIVSGNVVITFNTALTTATNVIQINANALKDAAGNVKTDLTTTDPIFASFQ